jgi:hypothetical protein
VTAFKLLPLRAAASLRTAPWCRAGRVNDDVACVGFRSAGPVLRRHDNVRLSRVDDTGKQLAAESGGATIGALIGLGLGGPFGAAAGGAPAGWADSS